MPAEGRAEPDYETDEEFVELTDAVDEDADVTLLDIELPDPSFFEAAQWVDARLDVLRGLHGSQYEGHLSHSRPSGRGRLWDSTHTQYLEGEWHDDHFTQLHFAQFRLSDTDCIRFNGLDALVTSTRYHFVARVHINTPLKVDAKELDFTSMKEQVQEAVTITKILDDDLKSELQRCRERFEATLRARQQSVSSVKTAQRDMFHIYLLLEIMQQFHDYEDDTENITVLKKISNKSSFSAALRNEARDACQAEELAFARNKSLPIMKLREIKFSWKKVLNECIRDSITNIKCALYKSLPTRVFIPSGPEDLNKFHVRQLFTCSVHDIQLFADLELTTRQHSRLTINFHDFAQEYVFKLWTMLIRKINNSKLDDIVDKSIFTNSVFLQLFKTFLELLERLCQETESEVKNVVTVKDCNLLLKTKNDQILVKNLQFIIDLMNHFKPGDVKNYKFDYKFSFFKVNQKWYKKLTGIIVSFFDSSVSNIRHEYVIWLYYIHNSFLYLSKNVKNETDNQNELFSFLNYLMDLFKTVVKNHEISLEKTRILASSLIRFALTVHPYFLDQISINITDMTLLLKQAEYMKDFVTANEHAHDDITNIVDIYQVFWDEKKNLITKLQEKYPRGLSSADELVLKFNTFVQHVFNLKIHSNIFLMFFRSFNEFIRLLNATNFPWYVKINNKFVELVDETPQSYLVKYTNSFLNEFTENSNKPPRQYLLEVAVFFIECTQKFLNRNDWRLADKIEASSELLLLMGRSFINFKKLPYAVDFNNFFNIFTGPFNRVTITSSDLYDFKRRLASLDNFYKYTMELNVMGVKQALELCNELSKPNTHISYTFDSSVLESCFNIYSTKFNKYVEEYILKSNFEVKNLANHVKQKAKTIDITKWDTDYKTTKLPKLLAGLSAVWSALESRDLISRDQISQEEQVMKPHCIQILCVLRLLGVDQSRAGFDSHLAQVLTGQGKSLVLGLLAATLALTGNRVRIVCYNDYLAKRDQNDFQSFYRTFSIEEQINYGTFDDMANEILNPNIKGKNYNLRSLVNELITGELPRMFVKEDENEIKKTVLLIDEVDVFFSPEFYGNTYNPGSIFGCETLAELQIKIWNLTLNTCVESDLIDIIQKYIDDIYPQSTDTIFVNIVSNSRDLLIKHVKEMISNAVNIRNSSSGDWCFRKFKLQEDGRIVTVGEHGEYSDHTYYRYKNAFMYFNLKKTDYNHQNFKNYGYINIICGSVSYAMLPNDYTAILGVTGTLKQLSDVEMRAVCSYQITRGSDMPTFFGASKLNVYDFTVKATEAEWISAILDRIMRVVEQGRAVLVFFVDEHKIDAFRDSFSRHLSRYSVLTGNEDAREVASCVAEAGVAKRVTVATRHMGRGVDFQSNDSAVEAKGGVHVIQTFFSADVKEETQIKGRTARKDNSGSYETILCREHLSEEGYTDSASSYWELNAARKERAGKKEEEIAQKIEKSRKQHDATMKFLRSFYDYNPNNRFRYFQNYPFVDL